MKRFSFFQIVSRFFIFFSAVMVPWGYGTVIASTDCLLSAVKDSILSNLLTESEETLNSMKENSKAFRWRVHEIQSLLSEKLTSLPDEYFFRKVQEFIDRENKTTGYLPGLGTEMPVRNVQDLVSDFRRDGRVYRTVLRTIFNWESFLVYLAPPKNLEGLYKPNPAKRVEYYLSWRNKAEDILLFKEFERRLKSQDHVKGEKQRWISPLTTMVPDSPLWKKWMTQNANSPADPIYLQNGFKAVQLFERWLQGELSVGFKEMLDQMHSLSAVGGGSYQPTFDRYQTQDIAPGVSRDRLGHDRRAEIIFGIKTDLFQKNPVHAQGGISVLKLKIHNQEYAIRMVRSQSKSDPSVQQYFWTTHIEGVAGVDNLAVIDGKADKISHFTPPPMVLGQYIERGRALMEQILSMRPELIQGDKSKKRALMNTLAAYYHVMINAHLYLRVNNSLLMNQVNYLLAMHGFKPIYHHQLDLWANLMDGAQFRQVFRAELQAQGADPEGWLD